MSPIEQFLDNIFLLCTTQLGCQCIAKLKGIGEKYQLREKVIQMMTFSLLLQSQDEVARRKKTDISTPDDSTPDDKGM